MIIGKFQNAENGRITGELDALLVGRAKLTFEPNTKGADYNVTTETGCEVGAAGQPSFASLPEEPTDGLRQSWCLPVRLPAFF